MSWLILNSVVFPGRPPTGSMPLESVSMELTRHVSRKMGLLRVDVSFKILAAIFADIPSPL